MWCAACQQDVPGVAASAADTTITCARCGQRLSRRAGSESASVPFENLPEFVELEDWEFAETIQQAERLVRSVVNDSSAACRHHRPVRSSKPGRRVTASSTDLRPSATGELAQRDTSANSPTSLPWLIMAFGLAVFVCGAVLTAWSVVQQHPVMWQIGLPLVLGGQVAILAVVIWQLDSVWNSNRATFVALHAVDQQVHELVSQWEALQQCTDTPDQPFYRHLAEEASPEVLLADLKDQLDLLSERLAQQHRRAA